MPDRIQRRRMKGWRMPEGAVYVGRPTVYGNPYSLRPGEGGEPTGARAVLVEEFRYWLRHPHDRYARPGVFMAPGYATCAESRAARDRLLAALPALAGRDLACWCPLDQPCHTDVLLEMSNAAITREVLRESGESVVRPFRGLRKPPTDLPDPFTQPSRKAAQ